MRLEKQFFFLIGIGLLGLIFVNAVGFGLSASSTNFLPELCLFKFFLGISCPGCGLTRAMICLSKFEFIRAYSFNPLAFLIGGIGLYQVASVCLQRIGKWNITFWKDKKFSSFT